jgi:RHS repeat-associated protein
MPFGEEIIGLGNRTSTNGYQADNIRQKFTQKERDIDTGLDYFEARYYSSSLGRFTSVDPGNAGANENDPQSWNGYAYARSNPILYTDPDGKEYLICDPDGKNCHTHYDNDFYAARRAGEKDGYTFTGNRDFFEHGQIKDKDGNVIATYVQISIDWPDAQLVYHTRQRTEPIPMAVAQFFGISAVLGVGGGIAYYKLAPAVGNTVTTLGIAGYGGTTVSAIQKLRNLAGMGRGQARSELSKEGFKRKPDTGGSYEKWKHSDGSEVWIRPNGEVVRVPSAKTVQQAGKSGKGWRVDPDGNVVRPHTYTPEKVQ